MLQRGEEGIKSAVVGTGGRKRSVLKIFVGDLGGSRRLQDGRRLEVGAESRRRGCACTRI
jgi:hypothetical protein